MAGSGAPAPPSEDGDGNSSGGKWGKNPEGYACGVAEDGDRGDGEYGDGCGVSVHRGASLLWSWLGDVQPYWMLRESWLSGAFD